MYQCILALTEAYQAHLYMKINQFQDVNLGQTVSCEVDSGELCKFFTKASILMHMITFCPEVSYNLVSYYNTA